MSNDMINQSSLRRDTNLKLKNDLFGLQFIVDSLESFSPLMTGNLNMARAPIHSIGLVYILTVLLCTPCLSYRFSSLLRSRRESQSLIVVTLIKALYPISRPEGRYTVGGEITLDFIIKWLCALKAELVLFDRPKYGILSDPVVFENFKRNLLLSLMSLKSSTSDIDTFISNCLGILSDTKRLVSTPRSEWISMEPFLTSISDVDSIMGLRKMFRLDDETVCSGSYLPSEEKVALFQVLVSASYVSFGLKTKLLDAPTCDCVILMMPEERRQDVLRRINILLQSSSTTVSPKEEN
jgi:hypothetical protein